MFFKKANIFFAGIIILALGTFGKTGPGYSNELEIEQESLISDELLSYSRSFEVTSRYYPAVYRSSVIVPEMKWPTDSRIVVSGYGHRKPSCHACSSDHKGIDFTPGEESPVYATLDGIVSKVGSGGGFGVYVFIEHIAVINNKTERWQTIYAHLKLNSVPEEISVGKIVEAGTIIGLVGNTGTSTGPHLHFEILVEGENVDPEKYLKMYAN